MTKQKKGCIPQEAHEDKPEDERKYRIRGRSFEARVEKLRVVFEHVARCNGHFRTLDKAPYTDQFDPILSSCSRFPHEVTALRKRFYWAGRNLKGYLPADTVKAEVRTERKIGKGLYQQVLKIGQPSGRTLSRGEYKRLLDGFGTNLSIYPDKIQKAARDILGDDPLKPVIVIESNSTKVLFHPDGNEDLLLEIKFDKGRGRTFDGFTHDIVEIEIEVKERGSMTDKQIEKALDRTEAVLMKYFADSLEPIHHSKVAEMVQHLHGALLRDKKNFHKAFDKLSGDEWVVSKPL
jgi:hypothetical protein